MFGSRACLTWSFSSGCVGWLLEVYTSRCWSELLTKSLHHCCFHDADTLRLDQLHMAGCYKFPVEAADRDPVAMSTSNETLLVTRPPTFSGDTLKIGLVQINNSFSGQNYLPY